MNIKLLALCITTSLALTACGGGSDSTNPTPSDSNNNIPSNNTFQQWASIYVDPYSDDLYAEINQITLDNGKTYSLDLSGDSSSYFLVTQNGLYDLSTTTTQYGNFEGNISISGNTWAIQPYSSINSKGLEIKETFKTIDISGKEILPLILDSDDYLEFKNNPSNFSAKAKKYTEYLRNVKFPLGSTCLQITEISNSEEYAQLDAHNAENVNYLNQRWDALVSNKYAIKKTFKDTIVYYDNEYEDPAYYDGVAKYKNQYYSASYGPKGTEFKLSDLINEFKAHQAAATSAQEKAYIGEYIQLAENSCHFYNPTALKAIQDSLTNYK